MIREVGFIQRTKDGFFNATMLIDIWNKKSDQKKILGNFVKNESTKEFIDELKKEGIEFALITGRGTGENSGTWMHPKLFVDLAMWISVEFKSKVIGMVIDGLILSRNDAGDYHKEMCATIMSKHIDLYGTKPPAMLFINESRMIKEISNLDIERNEMSEKDLARITILQKINSNLINKNVGKASRIKQLTTVNESLV